jgi:hypothetical protein
MNSKPPKAAGGKIASLDTLDAQARKSFAATRYTTERSVNSKKVTSLVPASVVRQLFSNCILYVSRSLL